ncbi:MAG: hypothetical protein NVS3B17_22800 [Vulcanimicrobiaceae bacterium]
MAGSWAPLNNQPTFNASTMLLLTDGTVLCQEISTANWWKMTPDQTGDYVNGTWTSVASGPNAPLYYASAVLRDGRVFVAGGEYNGGVFADLLAAELYDPVANTWTNLTTPVGWTAIGDAPSCVLPDGRILVGYINGTQTAIYDPVTNAWSAAANKGDVSSEETWTLLPDETIVANQCANHPNAEKYVIAADKWLSAGVTTSDLVEASSIEIGPGLLLPDGRLFSIGATGHTALYTFPPIASQVGTWTAGPDFPVVAGLQLGAKDAPGCLLPNGRVLCAVGPVNGVKGDYLGPTSFFEFDPTTSMLSAVADPPTSTSIPYEGRMLLLPSGQVLFTNGSRNVQVYMPDGAPDATWLPTVTSFPASVSSAGSGTYALYGRQLTGLSQAVSYGDDAQMATNYPLVSIRNNATGHVTYCRTSDHSTMSVNTGTVIHSTQFAVPAGIEPGPSELFVTVNGIRSAPQALMVSDYKLVEYDEVRAYKEADIFQMRTGAENVERRAFVDTRLLHEVLQGITDRLAAIEDHLAMKGSFSKSTERHRIAQAAGRTVANGSEKSSNARHSGKMPRP